jgi:hypothetical protein
MRTYRIKYPIQRLLVGFTLAYAAVPLFLLML